ncbi:MAG: protoheme IX farnesyltransferase [Proteobacteria bacterium]|nr:protoheme IX farnesyltransferase [Pseudomonadota bacterium]
MAEIGFTSEQSNSQAIGGDLRDFYVLLKPRVMSLVVFTALTGMVAAPGNLHPVLGFIALVAITVGGGASGALNMWWDADIDAMMQRTRARPIPQGRVLPEEALTFGLVLSVLAVMTLGITVSWFAAGLLAFTIAFYVVIYSMWLKRRTPQNIVIGGAAGAFPPMIGWAAVTNTVSIDSVILFLIIFMWTPPHFWALALYRARDYENAGVPMLPVVAGPDETRRQILIYSVLLVAITCLPLLTGLGGVLYGAVAIALGAIFLALAVKVWRTREGRPADAAAKKLFGFSLLYLFLIFATILVEHIALRVMS